MTKPARALVTGASGFIGAHCVRYLVAQGCQVRALDVHGAPADFVSLGVEFEQTDLRDAAAVNAALKARAKIIDPTWCSC